MDEPTRDVLMVTVVCTTVAIACLASQSAAPLLLILIIAFWLM